MSSQLIYVGDVPVESSYHGSALLYRLLESHGSAVRVVETGSPSIIGRRLPSATYSLSPVPGSRWTNTRFHQYAAAYCAINSTSYGRRLSRTISGSQFDSVLTVAHGFGWLSAAAFAESRRTPLHLIIHDDWIRVAQVPRALMPWLNRRFAEVYRQATSRLCVSPGMRDAYEQRYGAHGEVLYPLRAKSCPEFHAPATRLGRNNKPFTVAFAGTLNSPAYIEALKSLHSALLSIEGRLLIFGPLQQFDLKRLGLDLRSITFCGLLESGELIRRLRQEADALIVPMSFSSIDRGNMETSFPSKLADYTAAGLPIIVYGPSYCSAVRWADENPGAFESVRSEGEGPLTAALQRLASSPNHREALARRALEVGRQYFSHGPLQNVFDRALIGSINPARIKTAAVSYSPT